MATPTLEQNASQKLVLDRSNLVAHFNLLDSHLKTYPINTSYRPESPEVKTYRDSVRSRYPLWLYELLQNAVDYNNFSLGQPELIFHFRGDKSVSYMDLAGLSGAEKDILAASCTAITVNNFIRPQQTLLPDHFVFTEHGGGQTTLGQNGRGGKAGTFALLAEEACGSIKIESTLKSGKRWVGQPAAAIDHETFPDQDKPSYFLAYQVLDSEQQTELDKTTVTINAPTVNLARAALDIDRAFVLASPQYPGCPFLPLEKRANSTTNMIKRIVFEGSLEDAPDALTTVAPRNAKEYFFGRNVEDKLPQSFDQSPRVEMMDGNSPWAGKNSVVVDGVPFKMRDMNLGFTWSIIGFSRSNNYPIRRKYDSSGLDGNFSEFLKQFFTNASDPSIFYEILRYQLFHDPIFEIERLYWAGYMYAPKGFSQALTQAWERLKLEFSAYDKPVIVDTNSSSGSSNPFEDKGSIYLLHGRSSYLAKLLQEAGLATSRDSLAIGKDSAKSDFSQQILPRNESDESLIKDVAKYIRYTSPSDAEGFSTTGELLVMKQEHRNGLALTEESLRTAQITYDKLPPLLIPIILDFISSVRFDCTVRAICYSPSTNPLAPYVVLELNSQKNSSGHGYYLRQKAYRLENVESADLLPYSIKDVVGQHSLSQWRVEIKGNGEYRKWVSLFAAKMQEIGVVNGRILKEHYEKLATGPEVIFMGQLQQLETERNLALDQLKQLQRAVGIVVEDGNTPEPTRDSPETDESGMAIASGKTAKRQYTTSYDPGMSYEASRGASSSEISKTHVPKERKQKRDPIDSVQDFNTCKALIAECIDEVFTPDYLLFGTHRLPARSRNTLIAGINTTFADQPTFLPIDIPKGRQADMLGYRTHKKMYLPNGSSIQLARFVDSKLVGVYHPDKAVLEGISISHAHREHAYTLSTVGDLPEGLELYFEYQPDEKIIGTPTPMELEQLADEPKLSSQWRVLIEKIRTHQPPLTSKQLIDIALTAWVRIFEYDKDSRVDTLYVDLPRKQKYAVLLNNAIGTCAHAGEGLVALLRILGVPSSELVGYLGNASRVFPGPQNHSLVRAYLANESQWVEIEAQAGYLTTQFQVDTQSIPEEIFIAIKALPLSNNQFPVFEQRDQTMNKGADRNFIIRLLERIKELGIPLDAETLASLKLLVASMESKNLEEDSRDFGEFANLPKAYKSAPNTPKELAILERRLSDSLALEESDSTSQRSRNTVPERRGTLQQGSSGADSSNIKDRYHAFRKRMHPLVKARRRDIQSLEAEELENAQAQLAKTQPIPISHSLAIPRSEFSVNGANFPDHLIGSEIARIKASSFFSVQMLQLYGQRIGLLSDITQEKLLKLISKI